MKLSKKLFISLGSVLIPSLAVVAPLTSCSKASNEIKAFNEATWIVGNASYELGYFSYSGKIEDKQTIEVSCSTTNFTVALVGVYANNCICLQISRNSTVTTRTEEKADLTFVCKNEQGNEVWKYTLKDYTLIYTPGISFDESQKISTASWNSDKGYAYKTYEFELESAVAEDITVDVKLARNDAESSSDSYVSLISKEVVDTKLTVTVKVTGIEHGKSHTNFDMTISLLDSSGYTVYSPLTIKNFILTYISGSSPITSEAFTWTPGTDKDTLSGFDTSKITSANDTLLLPARSPNNKPYTIASGLFTTGTGNAITTNLPDKVKTLKINDITAITLPDNCFKDAPFTVVDLNDQVTAKAESDINKLVFGTDSLAFRNATTQGQVSINDAFNINDLMILQSKMWNAGLKGPDWFGATEVNDEESLKAAVAIGGNIYLGQDIVLNDSIEFKNTSAVLNLYGHKITSSAPIYTTANQKFGLIRVYKSSLTILDSSESQEGVIKPFETAANVKGQCAIECLCDDDATSSTSTLHITSGKFYGNLIDKPGNTQFPSYANNTVVYNKGAKLIISSIYIGDSEKYCPEFHVNAKDSYKSGMYMIDCDDESVQKGISSVSVSGGIFYSAQADTTVPHFYDPKNAIADWISGSGKNWLADGYKSVQAADKTYYKVSKN